MEPVVMRRVVAATQSPVNEGRWLVEMECGHEKWVTAKKRPRSVECGPCTKEAK